MKQAKENLASIFWSTITVAFVLLVHNGREPLYLIALTGIPILVAIFYYKRSLLPLALYLMAIGVLGRFTRYYRQNYASDTLLATRDYIGYMLAGKNVYRELIMTNFGLTPFSYLPASLFWYLPAYVMMIDLRFFEMLVATLIPIAFYLYGRLTKSWHFLPLLAVVAVTPFLLDLSADGSNDNSGIFLLLLSLIFFRTFQISKNMKILYLSAMMLAVAAAFKHYVFFLLAFFLPYVFIVRKTLSHGSGKFFLLFFSTIGLISLPFILGAPDGFIRALTYVELRPTYPIWGWNIWVGLRDGFGIIIPVQTMWMVRLICTIGTVLITLKCMTYKRMWETYLGAIMTMLVYLVFSWWTTYAHFTFLVPLIGLLAIEHASDAV